MKLKNILGVSALLIIGVVFGAILVSGFGWVRPSLADVQIGSKVPPVEEISPQTQSFNDAFVNVAEKVTPSIVQITVVSEVKTNFPEQFRFFFPFREDVPRERQGAGSGVIISDDGYILTNNHVVENATQVEVGLHDKRKLNATIVGTDPLTDLAVIKIDADNLPAAYLGNSDQLRVGQWVMAIGNPLSLASTVTAGIISAKGRSLQLIDDRAGVEYFLQTDAAINPGNSGGALVDLTGSVIGINTAIATDGMTPRYIGYGFAIPINLAKAVAEDLIAHGKVSRGYIGVSITEVDAATAKAVGLEKPVGVMVQDILEDGAAAKEDIKAGDIILTIDGMEVNQPNELQNYVARNRAGTTVKLLIYRDGEKIERSVTLKAPKGETNAEPVENKKEDNNRDEKELKEIKFDELGLTVKNMTETEVNTYKVDNGILITDVKNFTPAYSQRLFRGLVITEVDRKKIDSVSDFQDVIDSKKGTAILLKVVDREGASRFVGLEIPE